MSPRFVAAVVVLAGCSSQPSPSQPSPAQQPDAAPPTAAERCRTGDSRACDQVAEFWSDRQIPRPALADRADADAAALHVACDERGESAACMGLALMYKYGTAGERADRERSNQYWARVAELGDLNGFRKADRSDAGAAALAAVERECGEGRARSCNQAGWAAYGAVQRDKNIADAFRWYHQGCEAGSGQGCHWAGHFAYKYPDETGAADRAEAILRKGCELGAPGACDELGVYFMTAERTAEAEPLFRQSCEAGTRLACHHLATVLAKQGGDPGVVVALDLEACGAGEDKACEAMALRLESCVYPGVAEDQGKAAAVAALSYCEDEPDADVCQLEHVKACLGK